MFGKGPQYIPTGINVFGIEFYILEGEDLAKARKGMDLVYKKANAFDVCEMDKLDIEL